MKKQPGAKGDLLRVDNGLLTLTLSPDFRGSAISLTRGSEELLRSSYPEARPLAWENPWHGGITSELSSLGRDLVKEQFTARAIERRGRQGIAWKGVRMSCSPKDDRARYNKLELDYLLAPGSSVLALALRLTRRTDTAGWMSVDFTLWPLLGGSFLEAVLSTSDDPRDDRQTHRVRALDDREPLGDCGESASRAGGCAGLRRPRHPLLRHRLRRRGLLSRRQPRGRTRGEGDAGVGLLLLLHRPRRGARPGGGAGGVEGRLAVNP